MSIGSVGTKGLSESCNAALEADVGVGMFILEMANHQLAMRLLCAEARVDSHFVRTGKLPPKLWKNLGFLTHLLKS